MPSLRELAAAGEKRNQVIEHACRVLDAEVAGKKGFSGMAIKTAYGMVKGIQPGFIRKVVDHLLDDFLDALDPIYQEALEKNIAPRTHLEANPGRAAEALLAITDGRAVKAKNKLVKKSYDKLRPTAKQHVEAAVPRLGEMLDAHLPAG